MKALALGQTDLFVSELCLGCMDFGTRIDHQAAFAVLDAYYEAGGRFLDTANNYAFWAENGRGGESETVVGDWLRIRRVRGEMVIATKVGAQPTVEGGGFDTAEGLSAGAIAAAAEASLRRLGVDTIDLYYAHIDDRLVPLDETLSAFAALRRQGKCRAIGASNYRAWRLAQALEISRHAGIPAYACLQQRHSVLKPRDNGDFRPQQWVSADMLDFLDASGSLPIVAYSALLGGAYETGVLPPLYQTPENQHRLKELASIAAMTGLSINQTVLAALRQGPVTTIPLIASSRPDRLRHLIRSVDTRLDPALLDGLA